MNTPEGDDKTSEQEQEDGAKTTETGGEGAGQAGGTGEGSDK